MRVAIVRASETAGCLSARRFCGSCAECERVERCTLPEGMKGLVRLRALELTNARMREVAARNKLYDAKQRVKKARAAMAPAAKRRNAAPEGAGR